MTAIGEKGRLGPGESWRRAMEQVHKLHAAGAKKRYRVTARLVEPGWWAYSAQKTLADIPLPGAQANKLATTLPRCAQRARGRHGGGSKVAWPTRELARQAAAALKCKVYECKLPAPAIGRHWHLTRAE